MKQIVKIKKMNRIIKIQFIKVQIVIWYQIRDEKLKIRKIKTI